MMLLNTFLHFLLRSWCLALAAVVIFSIIPEGRANSMGSFFQFISSSSVPKIVGKDFSFQHLREFYYTLSGSTFPPYYQRYHFYIKDGLWWMDHEKREGEHWPLLAEDATIKGSIQLNPAQQEVFWQLLQNGQVIRRQEHLESGNSGPWLFLYWEGDENDIQEFTFRNSQALTEFEAFCEKLLLERASDDPV